MRCFLSFADILRNDWSVNKFFYGGYSTRRAGITPSDVAALSYPVNKRLWFAGEYTHNGVHGYAHSAYDEGKRAAERMILCMTNQTDCPSETVTGSTTAAPKSSISQSQSCSKSSKIIGSYFITLSGITVTMLLASNNLSF